MKGTQSMALTEHSTEDHEGWNFQVLVPLRVPPPPSAGYYCLVRRENRTRKWLNLTLRKLHGEGLEVSQAWIQPLCCH